MQTVIPDSSKYVPSKKPYGYASKKKESPLLAHGHNTETMVQERILARQRDIPTLCGCTWGPAEYGTDIFPGNRWWELRFYYLLCQAGGIANHAR